MENNPNKVRELIAKGYTEKALELTQYLIQDNPELLLELAVISGDYNNKRKKYMMGLILDSYFDIELNKIHFNILQLLNIAFGINLFPKNFSIIPTYNHIIGFIGREREINDLKEKLRGKTSNMVLIKGIGGVGKSAIIQQYFNQSENIYDHKIYIEISSNFLDSIVDNSILHSNLGLKFKPNHSKEYILDTILNSLNNIKGNNLFIIENVSHKIHKYLPKFLSLKSWKFIFSSRENIDDINTIHLDGLDEKVALTLFYKHSKTNEDDKNLNNILKFIYWHPLTIILLAKWVRYTKSSIKELKAELELRGLNLSSGVNIPLNDDDAKSIQNHIYSKFILDLGNKLKWLLMQYALLPSITIRPKDLKSWIEYESDDFHNIQRELFDKGWLDETSKGYICHKILREVIILQLKPSVETNRNLITSHALLLEGETPAIEKKEYLKYSEEISSRVNGNSIELSVLQNNIGTTLLGIGRYNNGVVYIEKSIKILEDFGEDSFVNALEQRYSNLAELYRNIGNVRMSQIYFDKSLSIIKKHESVFSPEDISRVYLGIANLSIQINDMKTALLFSKESISILENFDKKHPKLPYLYNSYALVLLRTNRISEGIKVLEKTLILITDNKDPLLGIAMNNLADLYLDPTQGEYQKSFQLRERAIKLTLKNMGEQHPDLGKIIGNQAGCLMRMEKYKESWKMAENAIDILKKTFPMEHPEIQSQLKLLKFSYEMDQLGEINSVLDMFQKDRNERNAPLGKDLDSKKPKKKFWNLFRKNKK